MVLSSLVVYLVTFGDITWKLSEQNFVISAVVSLWWDPSIRYKISLNPKSGKYYLQNSPIRRPIYSTTLPPPPPPPPHSPLPRQGTLLGFTCCVGWCGERFGTDSGEARRKNLRYKNPLLKLTCLVVGIAASQ